jgi:OmpA-OmpF porin, OOP family
VISRRELVQLALAAPTCVRPGPLAPEPRAFVIYFDRRSEQVAGDEPWRVLKEAADYIREKRPGRVRIVGHVDVEETPGYATLLSRRRARKVLRTLVQLGVPGVIVRGEARGDTQPAVRGPPGRPQPLNRRVEIQLPPGAPPPC